MDLAGSERLNKSNAVGDRLKEALNINTCVAEKRCAAARLQQAWHRSLSALGDVIQALAAKAPHIPFRNSKLTYLLQVRIALLTMVELSAWCCSRQSSLGGENKTLMIVQVSPAAESTQESTCSLKASKHSRLNAT